MKAKEGLVHLSTSSGRARLLVLCVVVLLLVSFASADRKEKVLYSFQNYPDGATPVGGVVFDKHGNLYGAAGGGSNTCPSTGDCGVVYELSPPKQRGGAWTESVLYTFKGHNYGDGATPEGSVILDAAGNLYGTTAYGGAGPCVLLGTSIGCGTVYEMSPPAKQGDPWTESVLYSFQGDKDGDLPIGNLTFDGSGNLYGATSFGGGFGSCDSPFYQYCGTIFELRPPKAKNGKWKEKVLHSFRCGADGAWPYGASLIFDKQGAIYGTTFFGGSDQNCTGGSGGGVAFRLAPPTKTAGTWSENVLHRFQGRPSDGAGPNTGLIFDAMGALYGTTVGGGGQESGVAFRLTAPANRKGSWKESILYTFGTQYHGADVPGSGLIFDSYGNLYGGSAGGKYSRGVAYRLQPSKGTIPWKSNVLYDFKGTPDGYNPESNLVFDGDGRLYGMTPYGGDGPCQDGCGTVFEISP